MSKRNTQPNESPPINAHVDGATLEKAPDLANALVEAKAKKPRTEKPGRIAARHFENRRTIQVKTQAEVERHARRMAELRQELEQNDLEAVGLSDEARELFEKMVGAP